MAMARPALDRAERIGRRLKLRDLHIFSAVERCGSMAKAAAMLGMSQPAVSESVAHLEDAVGVRLLDRTPRGVEPTVHGTALLARARAAFDERRQGLHELAHLSNPAEGEVGVACGDTLAAGLLPAAIERLSLRHPGIVVRVVQSSGDTPDFRELRERRVDLALARLPASFAADDLDAEFLLEDPHRVVVGNQSPWARRRGPTLEMLAQEPWLFPANPVIRELIAEAFAARGLALPREKVCSNSILLRNHLLATGRFLTVLPASVVRYNAKRWGLKALALDLGVSPRSIALLSLKHRARSPAAQPFVEAVRAAAKAMRAAA